MSLEILDQLEGKIKQAVETIQLLQLEVEELKGQKQQVQQELDNARNENNQLRGENDQLKGEHHNWQERLRSLLVQIDNVYHEFGGHRPRFSALFRRNLR